MKVILLVITLIDMPMRQAATVVHTQEFDSMEACRHAAAVITNAGRKGQAPIVRCIPK